MRLLLVGDVMIGRLVNDRLKYLPPDYPWGNTLPLFRSADVRICNLECVIADGGSPWTPKVFTFRSDRKNIRVLKAAGINGVSLANNHSLDYGYNALLEMLDALDRAGIRRAGAGRSLEEAMQPGLLTVGDRRIALLSFTDNEPRWEAGAGLPGIFYVPVDVADARAVGLLQWVSQVKARVDLLIVAAHWGPNWGYQPQPRHVPFAHALVEAGANLIFGHSCHVFQGIELYRGAVILYCCGDFVDDYRVDEIERNDQSFIFVVESEDRRIVRLELYPTVITRKFQARHAPASAAREIAAKMQRLCAEMGTEAIWDEERGFLEVRMP